MFRIDNHTFDFFIAETGGRSNGHGLILVCCLILCRHVDNAICSEHEYKAHSSRVSRRTSVTVEGNLDLRNTLRRGRDANQIEVSKKLRLVILYEFTFALENLHLDSSLAVCSGREDLRFLGRDGSITRDELSLDAAKHFETYKRVNLEMDDRRRR